MDVASDSLGLFEIDRTDHRQECRFRQHLFSNPFTSGSQAENTMQDYPHHYKVAASAGPDGDVRLAGDKLDPIASAAPAEFGGPGDKWSPETLLTAAVAGCFVLSFRAIARASKVSWISLKCEVEAILERKEGVTKFTEFVVHATLSVPQDTREERAHRLLEKAEESCLVTNSLTGTTRLDAVVMKAS